MFDCKSISAWPRLVAAQKLKRSEHGSHIWVHIEDAGDGCWDMARRMVITKYWRYWSRKASLIVFISGSLLLIPVHCCCGWGLGPTLKTPQEFSDDFCSMKNYSMQHPEASQDTNSWVQTALGGLAKQLEAITGISKISIRCFSNLLHRFQNWKLD